MSRIEDAIGFVRADHAPGSDESLLADVAQRACDLARHAKEEADTPFTSGLQAGALLVLGALEFPPEWRSS